MQFFNYLKGEQGRGFAEVASEVRSLVGRSARAAKEIKALIYTRVERVEQGTARVDNAGATLTAVVSSIRRVADLMGGISAASSLKAQAQDLVQVVTAFKLGSADHSPAFAGRSSPLAGPPIAAISWRASGRATS